MADEKKVEVVTYRSKRYGGTETCEAGSVTDLRLSQSEDWEVVEASEAARQKTAEAQAKAEAEAKPPSPDAVAAGSDDEKSEDWTT